MKKIYISLILSSLVIAALFNYKALTSQENKSPEPRAKVLVREISLQKKTPKKSPENQKAEDKPITRTARTQSTSFILAPLQKAIIPFRKETISASSPNTLSSPKGTKIIIPENAFVDEAGTIVQGNVDLQYREFHDHTDIFLSGIPMTYESGQLESAGMIEITASLNNKPLFINPNSKIKIAMPSSNQDPDFNLYYLDAKEKKWKLREENLNPETTTKEEEPAFGMKITRWSNSSDALYYDTYGYLSANTKDKKVVLKGKEVKLIPPQNISGNYYDLKVDLSNSPELSIYTNIKWQTIDSKKKRALAGIFPKKMNLTGNPIIKILHRIGESDSFKIRIAGSTNSVDIIFQPVFEERDLNLARKIFRRLQFSDGENSEDLLKEITDETQRENTDALVKRSFAIDGFGIWNCDRIVKNENSRTISVKLIRSDNGKEITSTFYFVNQKNNTVYTFTNGYQKNISYNPLGKNLLWAVLDGGKMAVFGSEELKNLTSNQEQILTMRVLDQEIKSPEDVKKILASI